ncbi:ATP-binding protein [Staphylococcus aureus]
MNLARFPKIKYLHDFDFMFQPSINQQEILTLKSMHFLEDSINICFLGNSGVGKNTPSNLIRNRGMKSKI